MKFFLHRYHFNTIIAPVSFLICKKFYCFFLLNSFYFWMLSSTFDFFIDIFFRNVLTCNYYNIFNVLLLFLNDRWICIFDYISGSFWFVPKTVICTLKTAQQWTNPCRWCYREVFCQMGVLTMSKKLKLLLCNFIEITLRHGCSPVNLLHIFRRPFYKNTSGGLLLKFLQLPMHSSTITIITWHTKQI